MFTKNPKAFRKMLKLYTFKSRKYNFSGISQPFSSRKFKFKNFYYKVNSYFLNQKKIKLEEKNSNIHIDS